MSIVSLVIQFKILSEIRKNMQLLKELKNELQKEQLINQTLSQFSTTSLNLPRIEDIEINRLDEFINFPNNLSLVVLNNMNGKLQENIQVYNSQISRLENNNELMIRESV